MKTIACFGSGKGNYREANYEKMRLMGRLLAERGFRVATGGYGGSGMEAPAQGAHEIEGHAIGYTLKCRPQAPNSFLDEVLVCGEDVCAGSNDDAMQYCLRLGHLMQADGFVVDSTDETPGTLIEFLSVLNLNLKFWQAGPRPIVVVTHNRKNPYSKIIQALLGDHNFAVYEPDPQTALLWLLERI